jgi:hypothetical protein
MASGLQAATHSRTLRPPFSKVRMARKFSLLAASSVGEQALGLQRFTQHAVQRFHCIRSADDVPDRGAEAKERGDFRLGPASGRGDQGVSSAPFLLEDGQMAGIGKPR